MKGSQRRTYTSRSNLEEFATPEEIAAAKEAWERLKKLLSTAPVLAYPDFKRGDFILFCDVSKEMGFGVALY